MGGNGQNRGELWPQTTFFTYRAEPSLGVLETDQYHQQMRHPILQQLHGLRGPISKLGGVMAQKPLFLSYAGPSLGLLETDRYHRQMRRAILQLLLGVRSCQLKTGASHGPKTNRAWPARRQTDGTSRCACSFCIYLSGSGGSPRSSPTETCKKKKAPPPPLGEGRRRGHPRCGLDSRIFDADSTPSSHLPCMTRE